MAYATDLTNEQWERTRPLLPKPARAGRPRANDRRTINAILYVLKSGCRWCDLPSRLGDDSTAHRRLQRWAGDGTWGRIWRALLATLDEEGHIDWEHCAIDASYVRAKRGAT